MSAIPVVLDCDPGHDDAIALLLALAAPELRLLGVTTVAGNSTIDNTTANALRVLELAGRPDIPVARGSAAPLRRPLRVADHVHGASGLDGPVLRPPRTAPVPVPAVEFLYRTLEEHPDPVALVPTGPLTNVAHLLDDHPDIRPRIARIVLMGGAIGLGNVTPAAEFNIHADPEAAAVVFASGVDLTMIGLDVTHQALLDEGHAARLRTAGACGRFVAELLDFFVANYRTRMGFEGAPIHDAVAVAHLIAPGLVTTFPAPVVIDCSDGPSAGRTLVDRYRVTGAPDNARVGESIDRPGFTDLLMGRLGGLP